VCRSELERTHGKTLDGALACSAAAFLLLIPANLAPFLTTSVLGASRSSRLGSAATAMWVDDQPWVAVLVGLFVVVFPLVRFGLLTAVLASLQLGRRPHWLGREWLKHEWLGPMFRWSNALGPWAMADVFLVGLCVAYARLAATVSVSLGAGGLCFIAAALLTLFTRATLDKRAVWDAIAPPVALKPEASSATCPACELLLPADAAGAPCPRCHAKVESRKPEAFVRAAALTLAGLLLYAPANLYPIATLPIGLRPTEYTVIEGVRDLIQARLLGLALLVFTASFLIPVLKLLGLAWCLVSVLRRSSRRLVTKTRLYRVVEEIGRWSMVDPFVIGAFVPVMGYSSMIYGRAEPAVTAFTGVVVLTMIGAACFDPRLMWDAARSDPASASTETLSLTVTP
jgi:paraquat-inducible protein A